MYKDDLILGDLYLESTQVSNLTPDQQQKLTSFVVDLVVKSEKGDEEALKMLAMSPEELVASLESQTGEVQTEAFENIRSKVGGYFGGTGAIQKRYEFLTTNLSKILWELSEDIKTTRSEEAISKYNALQSQLVNLDPALTPAPGKFQKAAYSVGKGVGAVGKVLAAGALAKSLLTVGLPIVAVGGIMGGVISVLKNAQNTRMTTAEKIKKALVSVGLGAMTAFAMGELRDLIGGGEASGGEDVSNPDRIQIGDVKLSGSDVTVETKIKIPTSLGESKGLLLAQKESNINASKVLARAVGIVQPDGSYKLYGNSIISREVIDGYLVTTHSAPLTQAVQ
jgi:hypothetical protein